MSFASTFERQNRTPIVTSITSTLTRRLDVRSRLLRSLWGRLGLGLVEGFGGLLHKGRVG